ncbi:Murein DD-endopeptidase MepM and murein hydrolase activator NlpD, contain LysM domain [Lachnospiraceae bacterium NK3A20]|nr:Murein DD-endopeptidase MepM and murein hydrolase activator NlpD, contain LysM domain [Lachnospiraceae bacterium NK3A20]
MSNLLFLRKRQLNNRKLRGRCVPGCALLFALYCVAAFAILPVFAATGKSSEEAKVTKESIDAKKEEIENSKKEREKISETLTDVEAVKKDLEASKADMTAYVTQLDGQLTSIQGKITALESQITEKEGEITKTQAELEAAKERQAEQYQNMKTRIRFLYENGDTFALEVLMSAHSFADMLNKETYIEALEDYDNRLLESYEQQTELVKVTKENLQEEKKTLEEAQKGVEQEEASMQALISEKETQILSMSADIAGKEQAISGYQQQVDAQDAEIAALEQQVKDDEETLRQQEAAAAAAAAAAKSGYVYTGGAFTWPAPVYDSITSDFGYRTHPIYGVTRFHSGLDMAADMGAPIVAAANGRVVAATYNASMGNFVMLDHGNGLFTVYMHASQIECSVGQMVTAGQEIAKVGSTGASTGPHLHFSVRLNGEYVNPWNYLGGG